MTTAKQKGNHKNNSGQAAVDDFHQHRANAIGGGHLGTPAPYRIRVATIIEHCSFHFQEPDIIAPLTQPVWVWPGRDVALHRLYLAMICYTWFSLFFRRQCTSLWIPDRNCLLPRNIRSE